MKAVVYSSRNPVLFQALEEIKRKLKEEDILTDFDFMLISLNYKYPYTKLDRDLRRVFELEGKEYLAFHSTKSIENTKIVEGVAICFIKFEHGGSVSVYTDEGISTYTKSGTLGRLVDYLEENRDNLNLFISAWESNSLGHFIEDLGKALSSRGFFPNLVGGVSSGETYDGELRTFQIHNGKVIKDGFAVITFKNIDYCFGISLGFKPISPVYTVSKADGFKVYEVDQNVPFTSIVKSFLRGLEERVEYLWYCPVVLIEDKEGYVRVQRTFKSIGEDYVEFFAPVYEGSKFMLSFGTPEMLLESTREEVLRIKEHINSPDLLLNFSCAARQYVLEENTERENEIIAGVLDAPLFGFATYGELGPDKELKKVKLYNETATIVALKERERYEGRDKVKASYEHNGRDNKKV
ncbi:MAG: hypothetical protein GXO04_05990 [Aquificae bacterium]|nr:hypothetical protein [Aquificota bacterium]